MRDVLPTLLKWREEGRRFALATVVQTWGSSPRPVGSLMGVAEDGAIVGSVSGGCVESAVIEAALESLGSGEPKMLDFGALSDASAWEVGLSCGGRIRVWVDPLVAESEAFAVAADRCQRDLPCVLITRYDPPAHRVWDGTSRQSEEVEVEGETWFYQSLACRERLIIIGAVHIAIPLVQLARTLGFETVVMDPRASLATPERFPVEPDQLMVEWPKSGLEACGLNDQTYAVLLTHDPKIDNDALAILLRSTVRYIGALGSHTTHAKRLSELRESGFSDAELGRIYGPVGLKIGARSPEEIALSIMAQIVQVRHAQG